MNKFAEMTTFVSVVDAHSFSEAARRLGTTKSQVSQRIPATGGAWAGCC